MELPKIRYGRKIEGISAAYLPWLPVERIDWESYARVLQSIWSSGLTPAVNMDTGFVNLLDDEKRRSVIDFVTKEANGRRWIAGALIEDSRGNLIDRYARECDYIFRAGGTPILFQSISFHQMKESDIYDVYVAIAKRVPNFLGFELGSMFAPFGMIYSISLFRDLLHIAEMCGIKHSSLSRRDEWDRLRIRDSDRPSFKIYTGNDLAIDMIQWGSDYLLGLSAFFPEAFAMRDRFWWEGNDRFYELNDLLQYLGAFSFRSPVPGYKHNCAMTLAIRGVIRSDVTPLAAMSRPTSDREILENIVTRIESFMA